MTVKKLQFNLLISVCVGAMVYACVRQSKYPWVCICCSCCVHLCVCACTCLCVFVDTWKMLDTTVLSFPGNLPAHSHSWVAITTAAAISSQLWVAAIRWGRWFKRGWGGGGGFIHPLQSHHCPSHCCFFIFSIFTVTLLELAVTCPGSSCSREEQCSLSLCNF